MNHDLRIWEYKSFAFGPAGHQDGAHRGCHTKAYRGYVGLDVLHCVVDRETGSYMSARAVDIHNDVFIGVLVFKKKKLRDD